jgi:hypothetical protein
MRCCSVAAAISVHSGHVGISIISKEQVHVVSVLSSEQQSIN